ncbi:MAG: hypothetical protein QNJ64_07305 [Crocosphaera sp.]|nr:hypothetical protein [Crocosphaera sp.]
MTGFLNRSLLIAGMSSLMTMFIGLETTQASPVCYMVDGSGQTIDLSSMCTQNTIRQSIGGDRPISHENGQERSFLGRRIANGNSNGNGNINITIEIDPETLSTVGRRVVVGQGSNQSAPSINGALYGGRGSIPNVVNSNGALIRGTSIGSYAEPEALLRRTARTVALDDLDTPIRRSIGAGTISTPRGTTEGVASLSTVPIRRIDGLDRLSTNLNSGAYSRNDYLIRRTIGLDTLSNPVSSSVSTDLPVQYILNRAGVMEIRESSGYVRLSNTY